MKLSPKTPKSAPKPSTKPKATATQSKSNPIQSTLQTIHGYPSRLKIYRVGGSSFWWVRATFGERRIQRSTKEVDKTKAVKVAKAFYENLLRDNLSIPLKTSRSFVRLANTLLDEFRGRVSSKERNNRYADDLRKQLQFRIEPFFKGYAIKDINYDVLSRFVEKMREDKISPSTMNRYLVSVRQILKHAVKKELLDALPIFPTVTAKDNPRPWFNEAEYETLKKVAEEVAEEGYKWKGVDLTIEMRQFIIFMVNTFLRPSDWYQLKRKHIQVQEYGVDEPLLIISPPSSKTINTPILSMPAAVPVFRKIVDEQNKLRSADIERLKNKPIKPKLDNNGTPIEVEPIKMWDKEAYVFLPNVQSRPFAQSVMRNFFEYLLEKANLKTSYSGGQRTIYSLRHTAIAFRLLKGENVDLLFLARNCRTSVDMIDRFYCRHLNALMAPEKIVGFKKKKPTKENVKIN